MKELILIVVIFLNLNTRVSAGEVFGLPVVTDGDTIKILNNKIRLHGIDAPEKKQKCIKDLKEYNCGLVASEALIKKISKNVVKCTTQKNKDRYNRFIGVCYIKQEKWRKLN